MARDTKVGLLVGMGVILLIGIILSDHLSVASHQKAVDMTPYGPQAQTSMGLPSAAELVADGSPSTPANPGNPGNIANPGPGATPVDARRNTPLPQPGENLTPVAPVPGGVTPMP